MYRQKWRYWILLFTCLCVCGNYFVFDFPAELERDIIKEFGLNTTVYSLLYAVYSFPNMILPLFSGLIIIKIGKGNAMLLFMSLVVLGNSIMILAPYFHYYPFLVIGRCIFGMGCETANIIQTIFVTDWFIGQEL